MLFVFEKRYLYRASMSERRPLTPEELADAGRLKAIYESLKSESRANGSRLTQDEIASKLGISQSAFSQYCRGAMPLNVEVLTALHEKIGIDPYRISPRLATDMARISGASGSEFDRDHHAVNMIDAKLSAGAGSLVYSADAKKKLAFRKDFLREFTRDLGSVAAFTVEGNSMDAAHILHHSVVLLDTSEKGKELLSNRFYGVWIGQELFIKQMIKKPNGAWCAVSHSLHETHPDREIDSEAGVIGRVFWVGFKL